jgi:isopentenyl phosphate kinase
MGGEDLLKKPIVLVKVGGSSITNKAKVETLDEKALTWFSKIISASISEEYLFKNLSERIEEEDQNGRKPSFIIVHGAGSFGHHCAKEFGLRGKTSPPRNVKSYKKEDRRRIISGLARTRARYDRLSKGLFPTLQLPLTNPRFLQILVVFLA